MSRLAKPDSSSDTQRAVFEVAGLDINFGGAAYRADWQLVRTGTAHVKAKWLLLLGYTHIVKKQKRHP